MRLTPAISFISIRTSRQTDQVSKQELRDSPDIHSRYNVVGHYWYDPDDWEDSQWETVAQIHPEHDGSASESGHSDHILALPNPDLTCFRYDVPLEFEFRLLRFLRCFGEKGLVSDGPGQAECDVESLLVS